jgi:serine/threonine protein kinase
VGSYRLVRLLAEGGMGQVYEVQHVELGRRAALKMLRPELAKDESMAARFFTEARAMSCVQHPGLVQVYEYGHLDDGAAYIVMEYVEGESLREFLDRHGGKISAIVAAVLGKQMASALQAAHDKNVIHRDLKPENIKIVADDDSSIEGRIKILDFGIAKMLDATDAQRQQTRPGQILGTPTYIAPEQAGAPGSIGPHTDVYALGVMLFEMLCGQPPFAADDGVRLIGKHLFAEPPRLRSMVANADTELDELLSRMLAKAPEARPSMREIKAQLGTVNRRITGIEQHNESALTAETFVLRRSRPTVTVGARPSFMSSLLGAITGPLKRKAPAPLPEAGADSSQNAETFVLRRGGLPAASRSSLPERLRGTSAQQRLLLVLITLLLGSLVVLGAWVGFGRAPRLSGPGDPETARAAGSEQKPETAATESRASEGSSPAGAARGGDGEGGARSRRKERRPSGASSSKSAPGHDAKGRPDEAPNVMPRIVD